MEAAGHAAAGPGSDAAEALTFESTASSDAAGSVASLSASLVASALAHVAVVLLGMQMLAGPLPPLATVIPVSLVSLPGGGGGVKGPDVGSPPGPIAAASPAPAVPAPQPVVRAPKPVTPKVARPASPPPPAAAAAAPASGAETAAVASAGTGAAAATVGPGGGGGTGAGGGDGSGGDGSGGARVAYGQNPLPPYPLVARRMGLEGVVLLEVLVAPDGRAADVRLMRSSGHAQLDDSALRTVRERWRFIPARRDGAAVESRVTVPIRFRLSGVEAAG